MGAEHAVAGGVVCAIRDAVPLYYRVHSRVTGGAATRWLGMERRDFSRVHFLDLSSEENKIMLRQLEAFGHE